MATAQYTRVRKHHYNIWLSRQRINYNEARDNTATGSGGAPLINHGTVCWTDNCLPSGNGDNDLSVVVCGNTATGGGGAPSINNETLSQTDNCLPSGNGDNDVSILACGNTATGGDGAPAINSMSCLVGLTIACHQATVTMMFL